MAQSKNTRHKIAVALQGGGSWGAFSWGVLDRLLEDDRIQITDISGTSAGAMSGAIVAHAINSHEHYEDGAKAARLALTAFWEDVRDSNHTLMSLLSMAQMTPFIGMYDPVANPNLPALSLIQQGKDMAKANPFSEMMGLHNYFNRIVEGMAASKLRRIVRAHIPSFDKNREGKLLKLHVNAAKQTENGFENKVFSGQNLNIDAVLASATLKGLFHPVEIDGEDYFDGAYCQNPSVDPLNKKVGRYSDILWVMANPPKGKITPRHQKDIPAEELAPFSDLVLHHTYDHLGHAINTHKKGMPHHHVTWFNAPDHYDQTSKQNTERAFLEFLYLQGRKEAELFLSHHRQSLGKKNTADMKALAKEGKRRAEAKPNPFIPPFLSRR